MNPQFLRAGTPPRPLSLESGLTRPTSPYPPYARPRPSTGLTLRVPLVGGQPSHRWVGAHLSGGVNPYTLRPQTCIHVYPQLRVQPRESAKWHENKNLLPCLTTFHAPNEHNISSSAASTPKVQLHRNRSNITISWLRIRKFSEVSQVLLLNAFFYQAPSPLGVVIVRIPIIFRFRNSQDLRFLRSRNCQNFLNLMLFNEREVIHTVVSSVAKVYPLFR